MAYLSTGEWSGADETSLDMVPSGGTWDNDAGIFYTKYFTYYTGDGDWVIVSRYNNCTPEDCSEEPLYYLTIYPISKGATNDCYTSGTSIGNIICSFLEGQGYRRKEN